MVKKKIKKARKKLSPLEKIKKELEKLESLHEKENDIVEKINDIIDEDKFENEEDAMIRTLTFVSKDGSGQYVQGPMQQGKPFIREWIEKIEKL